MRIATLTISYLNKILLKKNIKNIIEEVSSIEVSSSLSLLLVPFASFVISSDIFIGKCKTNLSPSNACLYH
ncbi:hypothetical protein BpHYR1_043246 [Brachionus plicatilis]|uniref:Uncharacterized protein n=1 Tax=Brachionus plicatilis TaxID=10195 RepID=A0A3M7R3R1_BRAPC|nr:hypothetical protein BpHYR1_043246 [Brachionus plicatilis]